MDNLDLRCPGEPENKISFDDKQLDRCIRLINKWPPLTRRVTGMHWGVDESKRKVSAIIKETGLTRHRVDSRINAIRYSVIRECVQPYVITARKAL